MCGTLLPYPGMWGMLTGVYESLKLLEGLPIDVWSFEESSIFLADAKSAMYEPVMTIVGRYSDFVEYENPLLGLLSSSSSIATRAARFRAAAGESRSSASGRGGSILRSRRSIERNCYVAGFDGVSNVLGGKLLGLEPTGTMPHALVQVIGDQVKAWMMFDKTISKKVKRTALVDTFWDEKSESVKAFETLGKDLWAVRLDTPELEEGRFPQDNRGGPMGAGHQGRREGEDNRLGQAQRGGHERDGALVDGFGVGTAVAYPPGIDFSAKIVEVKENGEWQHRGKRGGLGGRKAVYRSKGYRDTVTLEGKVAPQGEKLLKPVMKSGKITVGFREIGELRSKAIREIKEVVTAEPSLSWA